jgi:hypothetical protein
LQVTGSCCPPPIRPGDGRRGQPAGVVCRLTCSACPRRTPVNGCHSPGERRGVALPMIAVSAFRWSLPGLIRSHRRVKTAIMARPAGPHRSDRRLNLARFGPSALRPGPWRPGLIGTGWRTRPRGSRLIRPRNRREPSRGGCADVDLG